MNPADNTEKEKQTPVDLAKSKIKAEEESAKIPVVRRKLQTFHQKPASFLNKTVASQPFHFPVHLGRPNSFLIHKLPSVRFMPNSEKGKKSREVVDENRTLLSRFHQRFSNNVPQKVEEKPQPVQVSSVETHEPENIIYEEAQQVPDTGSEAQQVVTLVEDQQVANELMQDMIKSKEDEDNHSEITQDGFNSQDIELIKQAYAEGGMDEEQQQPQESAEEADPQQQYIAVRNSAESFLIPVTPKQTPEPQYLNAQRMMLPRRHSVCEARPSSMDTSVYGNLPLFSSFARKLQQQPTNFNVIDEQQLLNRHNASKVKDYQSFAEEVKTVEKEYTQDGNPESTYLLPQDTTSNENYANIKKNLPGDYVDYRLSNDGKYKNSKQRKRRSVTPGPVSRKMTKRLNDSYPHGNNSLSRSRNVRYLSRSPTRGRSCSPARPRTPGRPRSPSTPESIHKDDYIRLLIYDQNMVSGGILSDTERKIVRAFNTALAAAIVQDNHGIFNGFQLYNAEFKLNFYTFAVNDKKYISPLRQIVDGLPELWDNCKLGLMQRGKSLNFVAVVCEIPINGGSINFEDFLKILEKQNTDIDFNSWGLYKQIDVRKKIYMILRVESSIWKLLKERIIYFLSSPLQFRLRNKIARFDTDEGLQCVNEDSSLRNEFKDDTSDEELEFEEEFDDNDVDDDEEFEEDENKVSSNKG